MGKNAVRDVTRDVDGEARTGPRDAAVHQVGRQAKRSYLVLERLAQRLDHRRLCRATGGDCSTCLETAPNTRTPQLGRRPAVDFSKDGVEPSQAPESCPHRYLGHRQPCLVEEAFGSLHACSPCHL